MLGKKAALKVLQEGEKMAQKIMKKY